MLSHLVELRNRTETPLHPRDPALVDFFGSPISAAGQSVTVKTALTHSTVYACVRNTAETLASLPCKLKRFEVDGNGRRRLFDAVNHPLYRVLLNCPNGWQTAFEFWELVVSHLELRGNHYSLIIRDMNGQVTELIPIHPDRITPFWTRDRIPAYTYVPEDGKMMTLLVGEIFHIRNFTYGDGLKGHNPIEFHRETIGMGLASRDYGARLFANDARPRGVLYTDSTLSDPAQQRLQKGWEDKYSGKNLHRVAVLEEGLKFKEISMTNEDAQYLETRGFTDLEVARMFRVPPSKAGITEKSTFNNLEQQNRNWATDKIFPLGMRVLSTIVRDCLTSQGRRRFEPFFDLAFLLRGDLKTRTESNAKGIQWGWLSPNDVRESEGQNPIEEGGDIYRSPLNMGPLEDVDNPPEPPDPPQLPNPGDNQEGNLN